MVTTGDYVLCYIEVICCCSRGRWPRISAGLNEAGYNWTGREACPYYVADPASRELCDATPLKSPLKYKGDIFGGRSLPHGVRRLLGSDRPPGLSSHAVAWLMVAYSHWTGLEACPYYTIFSNFPYHRLSTPEEV